MFVTHTGFARSGNVLNLGTSNEPLVLVSNKITKGGVTIEVPGQLTLSGDGVKTSSISVFPNDNLLYQPGVTITMPSGHLLSGLRPFVTSGLTATKISASRVDLSWLPAPYVQISGYKIERSSDNSTWSTIAEIAELLYYSDTTLGSSSGTFYYRVSAVNSVGIADPSNVASVVITVAAPTNLTATAVSGTQINLQWTAPSESSITGYRIERSVNNSDWSTIVESTGSTLTSYQDTGLLNGTLYYYRVKTIVGVGSVSNTAHTTTWSVPGKPTILSVTAKPGGTYVGDYPYLEIKYDPPVGNTSVDLYIAYAYLVTNGVVSSTREPNSYATPDLSIKWLLGSRLTYVIRIFAQNSVGDGELSDPSDPVTMLGLPGKVQNLSAVALSDTQIDLKWDALTDDGGTPITGHTIERALNPSNYYSWSTIATTTNSNTKYSNTGLTRGTRYYYRVTAINAVGPAGYYNRSDTASSKTWTVPDAPTSVRATMLSNFTSARVSFDAPVFTGDTFIDEYVVYTRLLSDGSITSVTTTQLYKDITGLIAGQMYRFKVIAKNSVGDSVESEESAILVMDNVPEMPTNVSAVFQSTKIIVSWEVPTNTGGPLTYDVYPYMYLGEGYLVSAPSVYEKFTTTESSVDVTMPDYWSDGDFFVFRVVARNAAGSSAKSTASSPVEYILPP